MILKNILKENYSTLQVLIVKQEIFYMSSKYAS